MAGTGEGWSAFSSGDLDGMSPQDRARAEQVLAEYRGREPLAEVHVLVHGWNRGDSEVRWGEGGERDGGRRVLEVAIAELQEALRILGD